MAVSGLSPLRALRVSPVVFIIAVPVNYLWELAQAPLFIGSDLQNVWVHCFVAAIGDGLILVLILAIGWCVWRRWDWFIKPKLAGYTLMLVSGLAIAGVIEWLAVHVVHRWSYTTAMPLLPMLDIGVVPVVQMLVLPPLVFRAASAWLRRL